MSTHKHIDLLCVAILVCTVLITILFMNGSHLGIETVKDGDAPGSTDSAYFTRNDRDGDWSAAAATKITLSGDRASVSGGGAYVFDGDVVIAQAGSYMVSGTLDDGSIRVNTDSSSKVWIMLNGADIRCSDDAAIRVEQADKVFLTLAAGTENSLSSGAAYSESALADNTGGALYAHDDLTLNGSGSLTITAAYKHGIDANDELVIAGGSIRIEAPGDGIHVNEGLRIENAALTVTAGDEGAYVQGAEALLYIASGSLDIKSTGAGLKSGGSILIDGGTLSLQTEGDAIHGAGAVTVEGGDLTIAAGDDGIHADQSVSIAGGRLRLSECYEGIEALTIDISGGEIEIYPVDDGLNANGGSGAMFMRRGAANKAETRPAAEADQTWIHISGGSVTVVNDTARDADGLDSNGDIVISGGVVRVSLSSDGSNNAIDFGSESGGTCIITGGSLVASGSSMMAESVSESSTQCCIFYNLGYNASAGTDVTLKDAAGGELLRYTPPCNFSVVYLSCPELRLGETYTIVIGAAKLQLTLESVSTVCGGSMGGTSWGSMRQNKDNGSTDGISGETAGRPGMGGGQGFAPPEQNGIPRDFAGSAPPDMSTPPADFGGQRPDFGQIREREQQPAPTEEAPPAEAAAVVGPQPVSARTWVMLGACALVLLLGIFFAVKYRP